MTCAPLENNLDAGRLRDFRLVCADILFGGPLKTNGVQILPRSSSGCRIYIYICIYIYIYVPAIVWIFVFVWLT